MKKKEGRASPITAIDAYDTKQWSQILSEYQVAFHVEVYQYRFPISYKISPPLSQHQEISSASQNKEWRAIYLSLHEERVVFNHRYNLRFPNLIFRVVQPWRKPGVAPKGIILGFCG